MEHFDSRNVKKTLDTHGVRLTKAKGQHFLADPNILAKIVAMSEVDATCGVLEVGPGIGALTTALSRAAGRVVAVELDGRLLTPLRDALAATGAGNVEVVHGDILKLDIKGIVGERLRGLRPYACANLPYNITTPAIAALIEAGVFETMTVMVQAEVAQRMCALPGTPGYGAFTVFVGYHTTPRTLFQVPPECFVPRPKVRSSVVSMVARADKPLPPGDEGIFFKVVRAAFAQRRKTLVNALSAAFAGSMGKDDVAGIVAACGFDLRIRGEALSIEDFARIAVCFKER
jgi:16S rRNA (adenine1518-N6/adenine1519-N6)-dimethyltransferase